MKMTFLYKKNVMPFFALFGKHGHFQSFQTGQFSTSGTEGKLIKPFSP